MIGDVRCWLLKPLPWSHLDLGRYENQKVKVRCIISKRSLYLVARMHKNNVIGCRLIVEHFPEQLNFSGKNKPSIFCMWEKRRKQLNKNWLVPGLMMARTSWTSWAADGHPFKPARPLSNLFNPLYTGQRWEYALCIADIQSRNGIPRIKPGYKVQTTFWKVTGGQTL